MSENFIEISLGSHMISHGCDDSNTEVLEKVTAPLSPKLVAVSRIKSVSDKYILTDYLDGQWIYWEYEGDFNILKKKLTKK
ncbi:hypothetical protein [Aurantibacter sp.]|uniref:hypothetical protein n=1 Tax=Aurantibacter sp. TaxID=2807103 RepID=UPI0032644C8E